MHSVLADALVHAAIRIRAYTRPAHHLLADLRDQEGPVAVEPAKHLDFGARRRLERRLTARNTLA